MPVSPQDAHIPRLMPEEVIDMVEKEMVYCHMVSYKDGQNPYVCPYVLPHDFMNFVCPCGAWFYLSEHDYAIKHFTCWVAKAKNRTASRPDFQQDNHETCCLTKAKKSVPLVYIPDFEPMSAEVYATLIG